MLTTLRVPRRAVGRAAARAVDAARLHEGPADTANHSVPARGQRAIPGHVRPATGAGRPPARPATALPLGGAPGTALRGRSRRAGVAPAAMVAAWALLSQAGGDRPVTAGMLAAGPGAPAAVVAVPEQTAPLPVPAPVPTQPATVPPPSAGPPPAWAAALPAAGVAWAPAIQDAAAAQGLDPRLLASLVWVESSFDPAAASAKGAVGLAQVVPTTAADLGIDPADPVQNLRGGARYLRQNLDRFGRVELGLAAYNAGPSTVAEAGGIPPIPETHAYVTRVLDTFRHITAHPAR